MSTFREKAASENLKYGGYCPVVLVDYNGLLIPGSDQYGLINQDVHLIKCSSKSRAKRFEKNPNLYGEQIKRLVFEQPYLADVLNVDVEEKEETKLNIKGITSL